MEGTPLLHRTFSAAFSNWLDSAETLTFWLLATSNLKTSNWDGKTSHTDDLLPTLTNLFHIIIISHFIRRDLHSGFLHQKKKHMNQQQKTTTSLQRKTFTLLLLCKLMSPKPLLLLGSNPLVEVWVQMTCVALFRLPTSSQSLVILHFQPFPTRTDFLLIF